MGTMCLSDIPRLYMSAICVTGGLLFQTHRGSNHLRVSGWNVDPIFGGFPEEDDLPGRGCSNSILQ